MLSVLMVIQEEFIVLNENYKKALILLASLLAGVLLIGNFNLISHAKSEEKVYENNCLVIFSKFINIKKLREEKRICQYEIPLLSRLKIDLEPDGLIEDLMGNKILTCYEYLNGYGFSTFKGNRYERNNEAAYVNTCGPLLAYSKAFSKMKNKSTGEVRFELGAFSSVTLNKIAGRSNVQWRSSSKLNNEFDGKANELNFEGISEDGEIIDLALIYIGSADFDKDGNSESLINIHLLVSSENSGSSPEGSSSFILISNQNKDSELVKIFAKDYVCSGSEANYQCINVTNNLWKTLFGDVAVSEYLGKIGK
jgi:hypothetical protein